MAAMTPEDLQAIRDDLAAITPGKWTAQEVYDGAGDDSWASVHLGPVDSETFVRFADARFIAKAPGRIAALLAEVDRLRGLSSRTQGEPPPQCSYVTPNGSTGCLCCAKVPDHEGDHDTCYGGCRGPWMLRSEWEAQQRARGPAYVDAATFRVAKPEGTR